MDANTRKQFLLLYGSQTGQAQAIAEEIRDRAVERGLVPNLFCLSQAEKKFHLEKEDVFVVVVSTTGDGDPPDTVTKFWRRLKKKTLPRDHLSQCKYALLGLGDTNYTNFCNMGKMLNRRLLELGATNFYETGYADDGVGLELVVEPWIDGLWEALEHVLKEVHCGASSRDMCEKPSQHCTDSSVVKKQEVEVKVTAGRCASDFDVPMNQDKILPEVKPTLVEEAVTFDRSIHSVQSSDVPGSTNSTMKTSAVSSSISEVVNNLAVDVSNQLAVSSAALTSSDCSTPVFNELEQSLQTSPSELRGMQLSVPSLQPAFIKVELVKPPSGTVPDFPFHDVQYIMKSTVSMATIVGHRSLTKEGSVKRTLEVEISLEACPEVLYQPGDAFGFVCPNPKEEVDYVLQRLGLEESADHLMSLSIISATTKRNPVLPKHIPTCSVRQFFTHCADIRGVPKKAFLHLLSSYCSDDHDKRRLGELSSRQGVAQYTRLFTELHTDFLDVLHAFPSCQPPLERLIEMLPKLQPRYYSATSSPLATSGRVKIAFSVVELPQKRKYGGRRQGLATGWFDWVTTTVLPHSEVKVPIFCRLKNSFRLPTDPLQPIVMIGPGTGVSPFIGFLQHREEQNKTRENGSIGKSWLFFGCRHPDKDYIYREELERFTSTGNLTLLHVSFSRLHPEPPQGDEDQIKYVQDNMRAHWRELAKWVMEDEAVVYVCGDALNMSRDVHQALTDIIAHYLSDTEPGIYSDAEQAVNELKENGRYLVDVWS